MGSTCSCAHRGAVLAPALRQKEHSPPKAQSPKQRRDSLSLEDQKSEELPNSIDVLSENSSRKGTKMLLGQLRGQKSGDSQAEENFQTNRESFRARVISRGGFDDQFMHLPSLKKSKDSLPQHQKLDPSARREINKILTIKSPSPQMRSSVSRGKFTSGVFFGSTDKIQISPLKNKSVVPMLVSDIVEPLLQSGSLLLRQATTKAVVGQPEESLLLRSLSKISIDREKKRKPSISNRVMQNMSQGDQISSQRIRSSMIGRTLRPVPVRNTSESELTNQNRPVLCFNEDQPTPTKQLRCIRPQEKSQKFNVADELKSELGSATVRQSVKLHAPSVGRAKKGIRPNQTIAKPLKNSSGFRDQFAESSAQRIEIMNKKSKLIHKRARLSVSGTSSLFNSPTNGGYLGMYSKKPKPPIPEELMETPKIPQFRKRIYSQHKHPRFDKIIGPEDEEGSAHVKKDGDLEDDIQDQKSPRHSYSSSGNEFGGPEANQISSQPPKLNSHIQEDSKDDLRDMLPKNLIKEIDQDSRSRTSKSLVPMKLVVAPPGTMAPIVSDKEEEDCYCYEPLQQMQLPQPRPGHSQQELGVSNEVARLKPETGVQRELRTSSLLSLVAQSFDKQMTLKSKIKKIRLQADQGSTLYKLEHIQKTSHDDNEFVFSEGFSKFQVGPYKSIKMLGEGCFGRVYLVEDKKSTQQFALKVLEMGKLDSAMQGQHGKQEQQSVLELVKNEVKILKELTHPNTIQLKQYIESPNAEYIGIVMTYIEGFSLCSAEFWSQYQKKYPNRKIQRSSEDYIADLQVLEDNMMHDSDVIKFAHKLLDVLAYLHDDKSLIHKDLKTENILMHKITLEPYVLDFGISETLESCSLKCNGFKGTIAYLPPEVFCGTSPQCTTPRDMWALGIILYLLVYGSLPFCLKAHRTEADLIDSIKHRQ